MATVKRSLMSVRKTAGLIILIVAVITNGSAQNSITANDIVQRAIDSSGGEAKLDSLHAVEFVSQLVTADTQQISLAIKRKDFNKYTVSTLSLGHVSSTTIYNNGNAVIIKDNSVKRITDPIMLEDLLLQCYISIDYGYKKLGYKLTRLDDQKFQNFDCYTIMATSPLGKSTLNYYDKRTGLLLMVIYPSQAKSIFTDVYHSNGITTPSEILITDTKNNITQSSLQKLAYDNNLDSYWFNLPKEGIYQAPEIFRVGVFKYISLAVDGTVVREKDSQIETINGQKVEYKIKWEGSSDYLLYRLKDPAKPATDENIEYFKVKIISWDNNKYYCQYITSDNKGGTCSFEKLR